MAASDNPMPYNPVPLGPGPQGVNLQFGLGVITNPTGTTSATRVMMGMAAQAAGLVVTPQTTGRILAVITGAIANNTASDGATVQLRAGTGTPPANGAAVAGQFGGGFQTLTNNASTAAVAIPFQISCMVLVASLGVPIWFDLALSANTGGTASVTSLSGQIVEL